MKVGGPRSEALLSEAAMASRWMCNDWSDLLVIDCSNEDGRLRNLARKVGGRRGKPDKVRATRWWTEQDRTGIKKVACDVGDQAAKTLTDIPHQKPCSNFFFLFKLFLILHSVFVSFIVLSLLYFSIFI